MMSSNDIEILQQHLNDLIKESKDGDKTVAALRRILDFIYYEKDNIWISSKSELLIAIQQGQLTVFENGNKIEKINNLNFDYKREEVSSIKIEQFI